MDVNATQLCSAQTRLAARLKKPTDGSYALAYYIFRIFRVLVFFFHKPTGFAVTVILYITIMQIQKALYKQELFTFLLPTPSQIQNT